LILVVVVIAAVWYFTGSGSNQFGVESIEARYVSGFFQNYLEITIKGPEYSFQVTAYDPDGQQTGFGIATPDLNHVATVNVFAGYPHKTGYYTIRLTFSGSGIYQKQIYIP
jgi:hypothetical protein